MWSTLKSVWIWGGTALMVILWFPVVGATWLLSRRDPLRRAVSACIRRLNVMVNRVNPAMRIHAEGLEDIPAGRHYMVVANHQSMVDIPLLARLPLEIKWVAKHVLFRFPFTGWMMRMAGDIPVDTRTEEGKRRVIEQSLVYLQAGLSVLYFPEGRRSGDGCVYRFSRGAFEVAIRAGVPILPVAIDGLTHVLPMNTWKFGPSGQVRMRVLPPVDTRGMDEGDLDRVREQVRFQLITQLAEWRGCDPDQVDGIVRHAGAAVARSAEEAPLLL